MANEDKRHTWCMLKGKTISMVRRNSGRNLFRALYISLFIIPFIIFLWAELRYNVNMPEYDDYDSVLGWLSAFLQSGSLDGKIGLLFRQHMEHRIVFDRVVELIELHALGAINFIYLDLFAFLGLILLVLVIFQLGRRSGIKAWEMLPLPFLMLTFVQYSLISWSMASIQVYWALLFTFISILFVTRYFDIKNMSIGFSFSAMAAFTSAGGLIGFPAILIYYMANRKYTLATLWLLGSSVVFWFYFIFFSYRPTAIGGISHHYAFTHPFHYAIYVAMFLGNMIDTSVGALILGIILLCAISFMLLRRHVRLDSWVFVAYIFIIATGAADGLSRISSGMNAALTSRYTPFGAILLVLVYAGIIISQKNKWPRTVIALSATVFSIMFYSLVFMHGISRLKTNQISKEYQLVINSTQSAAYSQIKVAIKNKIFMPIANVYNRLPVSLPLHASCLYHKGYFGAIDSVNGSGREIHIDGWAAIQKRHASAYSVIIDVNGKYYPSWYGMLRPDIAKRFNQSGYLYSGYQSTIEIPSNIKGWCHISVVVVGLTRSRFYESPIKKIHCS